MLTMANEGQSWTDEVLHECMPAPSLGHSGTVTRQALATPNCTINSVRHARQGRSPTTKNAMRASLLITLRTWNFAFAGEPCCLFHAAVMNCIDVCTVLMNTSCQPGFFETSGDDQCNHCGLILQSEQACSLCFSEEPSRVSL
mmetsp:Transcript_65168/g.125836  ORF Transcript_65168/g.125836 Transcript_65168/m.125836 type:complete len:143 (+) Transcript_65168:2-430(+)